MSRKPVNPARERLDFGDDDSETPILHIDMDAFYASVELISRPELVGKPVIIGGTEGRGVVLSATYEARALGVHAAMPMSTARRLAPNAVVIPPSHRLYSQVSDGVMEIFRDITPAVEPLSLDEAFLDVSGSVRRLGSPLEIARLIRERVRAEQRITCSVGVAANKFLAKLASTYIKPDGLLLVPPERVIDFLHPLPVGALWGVGPKTEEQLHRLGLRTVREVAHTPADTLRRALGEAMGSHLAAIAWGVDEREVQTHEPEKSIGRDTTFDHDSDDPEFVLAKLLELCESVARRLRRAGLVSQTVVVRVRFSDFRTISRSRKLAVSIDTGHELFEAAKALFESLNLQRARIRLVGVRAEQLTPREEALSQLDLFAPEVGWREAEQAVDRATERFGKGAVAPARLFKSDDPFTSHD